MKMLGVIVTVAAFGLGSGSGVDALAARLTARPAAQPPVALTFRKTDDTLIVDLVRNHLGVSYAVVNYDSLDTPKVSETKVRRVILREFNRCRSRGYIPLNNSDRDYMEDIAGCINTGIDSKKDGDIFLG